MPTVARKPHYALRRDSWPPTMMCLQQSVEPDGSETEMEMDHHHDYQYHHQYQHHRHNPSLMDENPMRYFLSPAPLLDDGGTDDEEEANVDPIDLCPEMDMFDAGIEDPHHPQPVIRSISPCDITGPSRPPASPHETTPISMRSLTPPCASLSGSRSPPSRNSPEAMTPNPEDNDGHDDEDYVRFSSRRILGPLNLGLSNFGRSEAKGHAQPMRLENNNSKDLLLSHPGRRPVAPARRGWPPTSPGRRPALLSSQRPRSWSGTTEHAAAGRRLSPRAWREPSTDVWSIEEETEEETGEVLDSSGTDLRAFPTMEIDTYGKRIKTSPEATHGRKKVRFSLPVTEEIP